MKPNLPEIEARLRAATGGPWMWIGECLSQALPQHGGGYGGSVVLACNPDDDLCPTGLDKDLIANAPSDIEALLTYCRQLEAESAAKSKALEAKDAELRAMPGWTAGESYHSFCKRLAAWHEAALSQTWEQFLEKK